MNEFGLHEQRFNGFVYDIFALDYACLMEYMYDLFAVVLADQYLSN